MREIFRATCESSGERSRVEFRIAQREHPTTLRSRRHSNKYSFLLIHQNYIVFSCFFPVSHFFQLKHFRFSEISPSVLQFLELLRGTLRHRWCPDPSFVFLRFVLVRRRHRATNSRPGPKCACAGASFSIVRVRFRVSIVLFLFIFFYL